MKNVSASRMVSCCKTGKKRRSHSSSIPLQLPSSILLQSPSSILLQPPSSSRMARWVRYEDRERQKIMKDHCLEFEHSPRQPLEQKTLFSAGRTRSYQEPNEPPADLATPDRGQTSSFPKLLLYTTWPALPFTYEAPAAAFPAASPDEPLLPAAAASVPGRPLARLFHRCFLSVPLALTL